MTTIDADGHLRFGIFLAPFHPVGQNPTLALERDLELIEHLDALGFDPAVTGVDDSDDALVGFAHCPFRQLAEEHPELVCALHRGLVEGFVDAIGGGEVDDFHTLVHREPCQVLLSPR